MKKLLLCLALLPLLSAGVNAQEYVPTAENLAAREEFSEYRFGIFIHWGIYSMLGQGEWVMQVEGIGYDEYSRLAAGFNPSRFDAREWVKAIKEAGARYVTITSRHHDGFSMYDTGQSDYNVVKATPFGRDVIGEFAQACHEQDLCLHLYYSHLDWGRNDYWPLGETGHSAGRPEGREGDWQHYLDFMDAQLTELLTKYGKIGAIWFDGIWDKESQGYDAQPAIWGLRHQYDLIHSLQPGCLVGNNHHHNPYPGEDIQMFERDVPGDNFAGYSGDSQISALPLETCQTMNGSWGYRITDKSYKTPEECIRLLARTAGKGANLLLNIGPRPDGTIPEEALAIMKAMGQWLGTYGESIYSTSAGCVSEQSWGVTTQKDNILYAHIIHPSENIFIPIRDNKLKIAKALSSDTRIKVTQVSEGIILTLPSEAFEGPDYVVRLEFKNNL